MSVVAYLTEQANGYFVTAGKFEQSGLLELANQNRAIGNALIACANETREISDASLIPVDVVSDVEDV
jgi:hypothetical protein